MGRLVVACLRALQVVAALVNLVLVALVVNWYLLGTPHGSPSSFNFLIFAPCFSIISVLYLELGPKYAAWATHSFISLAVEATNTIFYFGGFIALAIFLARLIFCTGTVCAVARATSILAAAEFGAWITTTLIRAKDIFVNEIGSSKYEPGSLAAQQAAEAAEGAPDSRNTPSVRQIHSGFDFGLRSPRSPRSPG